MSTLRKNILTIIIGGATFILAGVGIFTALRLYQLRDQAVAPNAPESKLFAWDCAKYNFDVLQDGTVTVENGSDRPEPAQKVDIYIDGVKTSTLDVPAFTPRSPKQTLGKVTVPNSKVFTWKAVGSLDCQKEGSFQSASGCKVEFDEQDKLFCQANKGQVVVSGKAVEIPADSTLQTSWYVVHPDSEKTPIVYNTQPISAGQSFTVTGQWPGTGFTETVEIHFGLNVLDKNGNPVPNCTGSLDYYWGPVFKPQCPTTTPTGSPTATPTSSPTSTPTSTPLPNLCTMSFTLGTATATPTGSPTATPTSSPTSTPTSTPTTTPTTTPTNSPTGSPTTTPTSSPTTTPGVGGADIKIPTPTPVSLPAAGSSTFTYVGLGMGLLLILAAIAIAL